MADSSPKIGKIFIGGLSYETTDEKLRSYFGAYGTVTDAVVMKDPISRRSRGFGFITYADPACTVGGYVAVVHEDVRGAYDGPQVEAKRAVPRAESSRETSSNSGSTRGIVSAVSVSSSSTVGATKKIFVGGLHYETKDGTARRVLLDPDMVPAADFKKYFQQFGKVVSAEVMFNRETNKSRGFGFVIFETEQSVELVLQDRGHVIDGKSVEVKRAVPRTDAPPSSSSTTTRPLSARGSFSDVDHASTPNHLLSPRSTPVSPLAGSSSISPSLPLSAAASGFGGYAAAVRFGGRSSLPSAAAPASPSTTIPLEAVEQLNIDDRTTPPQERRHGSDQSRLFRQPPVSNGAAFQPPPYSPHDMGYVPNDLDPHNQWHHRPAHHMAHPHPHGQQHHHQASQWQQWQHDDHQHPQAPPASNVFGGGMFTSANGSHGAVAAPGGRGWDPYDPSFQFGLGGFATSTGTVSNGGSRHAASFEYAADGPLGGGGLHQDFIGRSDEIDPMRFGGPAFMGLDPDNQTESGVPQHQPPTPQQAGGPHHLYRNNHRQEDGGAYYPQYR
ncbi:Aste57867_13241 [Aphanomyces stellatus]|uniref:Aste57867_13241 protein n=1 Tax=Aphanomyces stellatus TaxID=120398 RepID=A0A485KXX7_9STRA|nr:hypothetical protein As57867_013192 [Aphanomyces stellatus]VFT90081.1 Aste57867_13241 [Aphanomyces stellatus]